MEALYLTSRAQDINHIELKVLEKSTPKINHIGELSWKNLI